MKQQDETNFVNFFNQNTTTKTTTCVILLFTPSASWTDWSCVCWIFDCYPFYMQVHAVYIDKWGWFLKRRHACVHECYAYSKYIKINTIWGLFTQMTARMQIQWTREAAQSYLLGFTKSPRCIETQACTMRDETQSGWEWGWAITGWVNPVQISSIIERQVAGHDVTLTSTTKRRGIATHAEKDRLHFC